MVCMGQGCSVALEDAVFDRCSLIVLDGARFTVKGSRFVGKEVGIGVYAEGQHTAVEMKEVVICGGRQGVVVRYHASFKGAGLMLSDLMEMGFECKGPGSSMDLRDVKMFGFERRATRAAQFVAVHVIDQGQARLSEMNMCLWPYEVGVHASRHASIEMHDSRVASDMCYFFSRGSTGELSTCRFESTRWLLMV